MYRRLSSCIWSMFSMGRLLFQKKSCFRACPIYWPVRNLTRQVFCLSVTLGFWNNSFDNDLSMSSLSYHLCNWRVSFAIVAKLCSLSCLRICLLRCLMGPLSGVSCVECHQSFCRKYDVGHACSYGCVASLWFNSHPCFASVFAWSFPLMFVWALILCSVGVCVRYVNILSMHSRINLSGWLLWLVGCLICVFKRYSMFRLSVNTCVGSFWYVLVRSCRVWC